jgi:hypothetical protein
MKLLLPVALLLGLSLSANAQQPPSKVTQHIVQAQERLSYRLSKVAHSQNVVLTTAQYTGVLLNDPGHQPRRYGLIAHTLSPADVVQAERILARCTQQGQVSWYWYKLFKDSTQQSWPYAIHPLPFYVRQYKGLYTEDGQRVVWINAFPQKALSSFLNWQTMEVEVQDGGKAFFNIYVNLDKQHCFNFMRNSIGG